MPTSENESSPSHISINVDDIKGHEGNASPSGGTPKSSTGWDGKLRLEKKIELANPEALSNSDYSDEEQVLPGETIEADEGMNALLCITNGGAVRIEMKFLGLSS